MSGEDDPMIVWETTLDDHTWGCRVKRTEPYNGVLTVWRVKDGKEILSEPVTMAYDALFGPDVDDMTVWQNRVIEVVDSCKEEG
jgi:hypothetical protein